MALIWRRRATPAHPNTLALLRGSRGASPRVQSRRHRSSTQLGQNASGTIYRFQMESSSDPKLDQVHSPELADTSDIIPSLDGHPETSVASSRIERSGGAQRSKR